MANEPPDFTHSRNVVQTRANPLLPALERSVDGYGGLSSSGAQNCIGSDALVAILSALIMFALTLRLVGKGSVRRRYMPLDPIFLCSLQLTSFRVFKTISRCHNSKDAPSALLFPCVFVFLLCPAVFSLRRTDHHHEIITNIICIIINLLLVKK